MIKIEKFDNGRELNLNQASSQISGYGHQTISIEMEYRGEYRSFRHITTNIKAVDHAKELGLESWEEKALALYSLVESSIEESVYEWVKEVDFDLDAKYIISINFGSSTEYWNSSAIADDCTVKLIDSAEGFDTEDEAESILEEVVIPHGHRKGWNVKFHIDKY